MVPSTKAAKTKPDGSSTSGGASSLMNRGGASAWAAAPATPKVSGSTNERATAAARVIANGARSRRRTSAASTVNARTSAIPIAYPPWRLAHRRMSGGIATSARRDPARALYRRSSTTGNSTNVKIAGRSVQRDFESTRASTTTNSAATNGAPPRRDSRARKNAATATSRPRKIASPAQLPALKTTVRTISPSHSPRLYASPLTVELKMSVRRIWW